MAKLVIVPLVNSIAQTWFAGIGYRVLQAHKTTVYLGCLIRFKVTPSVETEFLLGKVRKRLSHWANRSLSFAGRSILLRHAIRVMPIYHLLSMTLNTQGFVDLECIARDFWWGKNKDGEIKKPLVAWRDTTLCKAEGGIDFNSLYNTSLVLKMHWLNMILLEDSAIWVLLACACISKSLDKGFR